MLYRLLLLFTLLPLVELAILVWIADRTSLWLTIGLVLLTGIIGAALAKLQGWRMVRRIQADLSGGRMPADALVDALLILVAGALLVTPGLLTDVGGFSLLIPPFRRWMRGRLKRRFANRFRIGGTWRTADRSEIVDAKIVSEKREEQ